MSGPRRAGAIAQQTLDEARRRQEAAEREAQAAGGGGAAAAAAPAKEECPQCHGRYENLAQHIAAQHYEPPKPMPAAGETKQPVGETKAPAAETKPPVAETPPAQPRAAAAPAPRPAPAAVGKAGTQPPPPSRMTIGGGPTPATDRKPWKMLLGGTPGVGKTTFGVESDDPIFLPVDLDEYVVPKEIRYPQPRTWNEAIEALENCRALVESGQRKVGTFVVDHLDALAALAAEHVKKKAQAEYLDEVGGGYNKGINAAIEELRIYLMRLERLRSRGVNILILAHCEKGKTSLPGLESYDSWNLSVHPKIAQLVVGWVEIAGFAYIDVTLTRQETTVGKRKRQGRAVASTRARWINFVATATALWCKNRQNLTTLALSFEAFAAANGVSHPEELDEAIAAIRDRTAMLEGVKFRDRDGAERLLTEWAEGIIADVEAKRANGLSPAAASQWHKLLSKTAARLDAKIEELGIGAEVEQGQPAATVPDSTDLNEAPPPVDEEDPPREDDPRAER